jgi:hypothetical protein
MASCRGSAAMAPDPPPKQEQPVSPAAPTTSTSSPNPKNMLRFDMFVFL